jgi:hypothetical protein
MGQTPDDVPPQSPPPQRPPVVFRYTRAQAIADAVLVDLTAWAREVGFVFPVACTAAVWHGCVVPPDALRGQGQSERGRGHDLVWMLRCAIQRGTSGGDQLAFDVLFLMSPDETAKTVRLKAVCGPGDSAEPVITVMLPDED